MKKIKWGPLNDSILLDNQTNTSFGLGITISFPPSFPHYKQSLRLHLICLNGIEREWNEKGNGMEMRMKGMIILKGYSMPAFVAAKKGIHSTIPSIKLIIFNTEGKGVLCFF